MLIDFINSNYDIILKIDSTYDKVALLRSNSECSLYVEVIDSLNLTKEIIELDNEFVSPNYLNDMYSINVFPKYENYFILNDNLYHKFTVHSNLITFIVDFESKRIALESTNQSFYIKNTKNLKEPINKSSILILKLEKKWKKRKAIKLNRDNHYDDFLGSKMQFVNKKLIHFKSGYKGFINIKDFDKKNTIKQKLLHKKFLGKEYLFEYVRYFFLNQEKNIFGFLAENPTYGVDGLRIFDITNPYKFKVIYEEDYLDDKNRQHLKISKCGNKIISLNLRYPNNFQVIIQDFHLNISDVIESSFTHTDNRIIDEKIFKENFYCVITTNKIILFDLINKSEYLVLNRDDLSPYNISEKYIFYKQNNNLKIEK